MKTYNLIKTAGSIARGTGFDLLVTGAKFLVAGMMIGKGCEVADKVASRKSHQQPTDGGKP